VGEMGQKLSQLKGQNKALNLIYFLPQLDTCQSKKLVGCFGRHQNHPYLRTMWEWLSPGFSKAVAGVGKLLKVFLKLLKAFEKLLQGF
jgi:hypothetical protein